MSKPSAKQESSTPADKAPANQREENLDDFSPEWCQKLINDPAYKHIGPSTRAKVGGPTGYSFNSLMGRTLFTDNTIRAIKLLHKPGTLSKGETGELLALYSLGSEMCSHPGVLHGGICTTIFDEVAGALAVRESVDSLMAVNLNLNLRKSVKAPGIILVRAWIEKPPEGRKLWVKGVIEQDGAKCCDGEGMWLRLKPSPKM